MRVLAIGAHPDDVELACGGTLLRHLSKDDEVHVVVLSNGEYSGIPDEAAAMRARRCEATDAWDTMGYTSWEFIDESVESIDYFAHETVEILEEKIGACRIDRVYGHSSCDVNQHHRYVAEMSLVAVRFMPEVFLFETPSTMRGFQPTMAVNVTKEFETKMKALACFESQSEKMYMRAGAVEGLANHRAFQFGLDHDGDDAMAEVFQVERLVVR